MHYELERFGQNGYLEYATHQNFSYPTHFHRSLEFIYLEYGTLTVVQANTISHLEAGDSLLFLPNTIHGYESHGTSLFHSVVFSPDLVPDFMKLIEGRNTDDAKFTLKTNFFKSPHTIHDFLENDLKKRGLLLLICGDFYHQVSLTNRHNQDESLLYRIIDYIGCHFKETVHLDTLGKALGYDPFYLSRYISANLHTTFHKYLTSLRLAYAVDLLLHTEEKMVTIALQSGFPSVRTFNSVFKNEYRLSPTNFKKKRNIL